MSIPNRLAEIVSMLMTGTREGTLSWGRLSASRGYATAVGKHTISISDPIGGEPDGPPSFLVLRVLSPSGDELDECALDGDDEDFAKLYSLMNAAYESVDRHATTQLKPVADELRRLVAGASGR